ncbi:ParB N-terminal domain-containing protein [Larkinella terrae]|uniref:ParB/Sulfiredoxin domain-containing protein n=1 Tax=Larkinella terrae TaxID=2025311 RepID=A0A7K0EJI4_9BACT|nr:ParB N-terminal domain-containing protein [Larkinella terrae]MRS61902.1 hypothetical protein [Larkinella terrae]
MTELFTTEKRRVQDLVPYEKNPRKITAAKQRELETKIGQFGLIGLPVVDADGTLIAGHQRCKVMLAMGKGDEMIDVRVATRKLTEAEFKEISVIENSTFGEWDKLLLQSDFSDFVDLGSYGIDLSDLEQQLKEALPEDEKPEMPIVAKFSEKYTAFIIVCTNEIDENNVAEQLGVETMRCYKASTKIGKTHVITANQFQTQWNARS